MNISELITKVVQQQNEIYSKVGKFLNMSSTYDNRCDVELLDGSIVYDVRLNADETGGSFTKPVLGSYVIVTFLSREEAFVSLISNADFTRVETVDEVTGEKSGLEITNEGSKSTVNIYNVNEFNLQTSNNGKFSIKDETLGDIFIIRDVNKIRIGIKNQNEIVIDENGISLLTTEGQTKIGNDLISLAEILNEIIDVLLNPSLLTPPLPLNPLVISQLQSLKTKIATFLI